MTAQGAAGFVDELRRLLGSGFPIVCVVTHEEARALELVRSIVPKVRVPVWTATRGFEPGGESREPAAAVAHMARAGSAGLFVLLDLHPYLEDPAVVRGLRDFVQQASSSRKAAVLVMPFALVPPELDKDVAVLELALPGAADLEVILREALGGHPAQFDAQAAVRAARGLTAAEAARAFRLARTAAEPAAALARIAAEKRRTMRRAAALELVATEVGLEQVGGLEALKGWLRTRVAAFGEEARVFGLPEPRGMLVCGVQGCGKSLVAKAASRVFGVPLIRLDFASVFATRSPEEAIRQAMRITEAIAPVVLWVDEIEKGLGGAQEGGAQARVFGDFLIWLQEKRAPVFVAATANEVERLPAELARRGRFDEVFFVDLPGAREREEILAIHLRERGRDPSGHALEAIAKALDHFSGAEIEQVVVSALFRAFAASRELCDEDLRVAAGETIPLATMYEEKVQALRTWAQARARRASADRRTLELFED
jgi:SpoVK/Ycf46/Vps4 family AAA+-type ATPase